MFAGNAAAQTACASAASFLCLFTKGLAQAGKMRRTAEPHRIAHVHQLTRPAVCSAASFQRHKTIQRHSEKSSSLLQQFLPLKTRNRLYRPHGQGKTCLATLAPKGAYLGPWPPP
jgi:hypothetical protein